MLSMDKDISWPANDDSAKVQTCISRAPAGPWKQFMKSHDRFGVECRYEHLEQPTWP